MNGKFGIFAIPDSKQFASDVCKSLKIDLGKLTFKDFSDGEWHCQFQQNIRGMDVFIIASTQPPIDHWFQLWIAIDAAKRAKARRITAVIPYYGYARQERKSEPRVPITAKMVAIFTEKVGAHLILTMDLHAPAIEGFFEIPVDPLWAADTILESMIPTLSGRIIAVAPDHGAAKTVGGIAKRYNWPLRIIDKNRPEDNKVDKAILHCSVVDGICVIIDDLIDTAGTICSAVAELLSEGAKEVHVMIPHAVLSGSALERISESKVTKIWIADTIKLKKTHKKIKVVSVSSLFGKAISNIHNEESISSLFPK
ncbi:ribose-phosphate diphosphokinase [bacterium]|jgi:ribose-phosphate pyrophosphokinase|nr:ribose-phosphate diphosphokinase [bacterium]MBT4121364.1 ribose-phosphate diphosphokinase [bacterium]MBT4495368.1 ribose-phosphate diphosphokinase [bacterium]MBT4764107.1 ribose-phosphate diphosphokinase [bacterium]MBT5942562.1 ribose-phosphate diphosphokinase [bacterium]